MGSNAHSRQVHRLQINQGERPHSTQKTLCAQCLNVGPPSATMAQPIKPALNKRIEFADYCRSCNIREVLIFAIFREEDKFTNLRILRKYYYNNATYYLSVKLIFANSRLRIKYPDHKFVKI